MLGVGERIGSAARATEGRPTLFGRGFDGNAGDTDAEVAEGIDAEIDLMVVVEGLGDEFAGRAGHGGRVGNEN